CRRAEPPRHKRREETDWPGARRRRCARGLSARLTLGALLLAGVPIHQMKECPSHSLSRRGFLRAGLAAGLVAPSLGAASRKLEPKADAVIFVWLPGGVNQADTWDPKEFTPFEKGMKGSDLLSTCESIPTSVDGLQVGDGLEQMASIMHHATVLRSLTN